MNASILVVEDSNEDFDVLRIAFQEQGIGNTVWRLSEGSQVMPFLESRLAGGQPLPALIILDLNLIGVDGREVLRRLKRTSPLRKIPVIILSTSANARDIDGCYAAGAACYALKPVSLEKFESLVAALKSFWLTHAILPKVVAEASPRSILDSSHVRDPDHR